MLFVLGTWALAAPVVLPVSLDDPDYWDEAQELLAGLAAVDPDVTGLIDDGTGVLRPVDAFRPDLRWPALASTPVKEAPGRRGLPVLHPGRGDGDLSGKAVYVSQCHGWMYYDTIPGWSTQRGVLFDTVEDFHNPEGADAFLIPYLENAGATVFAARERDVNPRMAIADNDGQGYAEVGAGFVNGPAGFRQLGSIPYGTDPFDAGTTRRFPADGGGVARWRPVVPADGLYAVYVTWDSDPTHAPDAHYRITHPGGVIDRVFDQTTHGSTWQHVETLYLRQGNSLTVELIADSAVAGRTVNADAVRIGGGAAEVSRAGQVPSVSRWEEAALTYVQYNGAPASIYDPTGNGNGTDHIARAKWADWEHPGGEDAVYVSWHSNASDGNARGTTTYYAGGGSDAPAGHDATCGSDAVTGSYSLARLLQDEIVTALRALQDPGWANTYGDRGLNRRCFSEVSPTYNDEMPSALVELAFHDNATDAAFLKDPAFRRDASRAMYRAVVTYFAQRDGRTPHFLPEPPAGLSVRHDPATGRLRASWTAGPVGAPYGDAAQDYLVETSPDGMAWTRRFAVGGTTTLLDAAPGETIYVRVSGLNDGGLSFPSEVVGARRDASGAASILVVSAFDRWERSMLPRRRAWTVGDVVTMDLPHINPFDTAAITADALAAAGFTFDAVADEALPSVDLSGYDLMVWVLGEESTVDSTFSPAEQALVAGFLADGGALWTSGAEILWDLDARGSAADQAFAEDVLGALMAADDAGTEAVDGVGLLAGVGAMDFAGGAYPVEFPDVLDSARPVIARYDGGGVAAVLGGGVALMGFPFETIADRAVRVEVARRIVGALAPAAPVDTDVPEDTGDPRPPGDDTDTPSTDDTDAPDDTDAAVTDDTDAAADDDPKSTGERLGCAGGCKGCVSTSHGGGGPAMLAAVGLLLWRRRRGGS